MLVIPTRAARCRGDHADRLVVETAHLIRVPVLPRCFAELLRPRIGVALALEANQDRRRRVRVRLRIPAVFVLPDPEIEAVIGHERLDAAPAERAAIIERQIAVDDIGNKIGPAHRQTAHRIGLDVILGLVEIAAAAEAIAEHVRVVEHRIDVLQHVEHIGCGGPGQQQRSARGGVHQPVPGVDGDREHGSLLPFEYVLPGVAFLPHFGGAAALHHQENLFVHVLFGV